MIFQNYVEDAVEGRRCHGLSLKNANILGAGEKVQRDWSIQEHEENFVQQKRYNKVSYPALYNYIIVIQYAVLVNWHTITFSVAEPDYFFWWPFSITDCFVLNSY